MDLAPKWASPAVSWYSMWGTLLNAHCPILVTLFWTVTDVRQPLPQLYNAQSPILVTSQSNLITPLQFSYVFVTILASKFVSLYGVIIFSSVLVHQISLFGGVSTCPS